MLSPNEIAWELLSIKMVCAFIFQYSFRPKVHQKESTSCYNNTYIIFSLPQDRGHTGQSGASAQCPVDEVTSGVHVTVRPLYPAGSTPSPATAATASRHPARWSPAHVSQLFVIFFFFDIILKKKVRIFYE